MTGQQLADLADSLRALLARIDAGDLDSSAATRYRLEGAVVALDVVTGKASSEILGNLLGPS